MKSSARKVELASAADLFSTEQERQDAKLEKLQIIPLAELHPFPDHPFSVKDDDSMQETVESIKERGVLQPAIARLREGGGYELVSGHRRKRACELAGLDTMPVIVRDLDRDTAIIFMVDSNIQRENISPMEKARALKIKMEAIRRQGTRTDLTSPNNSAKFRSDDEIGTGMGMSGDTVRNMISLTQLVPELQQMVDDKKIAVTPAYQIAALKPEEQALLVETIESEQTTPSVSQAQRMKKLSQSGELNEDTMLGIMSEEKKPEVDKIVFTSDTLRKYFPRSYTPRQMQDTIAYQNACKNSDKETALIEGNDAVKRAANAVMGPEFNLAPDFMRLYFDLAEFRNRLHREILDETYPVLSQPQREQAPDLSGQPITREGDTITIGSGDAYHEVDITVSDEEWQTIQQVIGAADQPPHNPLAPAYKMGDTVYLNNTAFEITDAPLMGGARSAAH